MSRTSRSIPMTASDFPPATRSLPWMREILSLHDPCQSVPRVAMGEGRQPGVVGAEGVVVVPAVEPPVGPHRLPVVGAYPLDEQRRDDDQTHQVAGRPQQSPADV